MDKTNKQEHATKRTIHVLTALLFMGLNVALPRLAALTSQDPLSRARRIHEKMIGIDSHIDTLQRVLNAHEDISRRTPGSHVDLPRLREAGMRAPFFALYVPTYYKGSEAVRRTLELRDAMQSVLDGHSDQIELATSASDVERIANGGKIAAVLSLESGHAIADDLAVLRMYHRLGVRSMTLTHFRNNNWADSSTDKPQHDGLTDFGREVVREMNRIGMIVDISHVSDKTFYDTLKITSKPLIASHSSCRALCRRAPQYDRRYDPRPGQEWRRYRDQFRREFCQPKGPRNRAPDVCSTELPLNRISQERRSTSLQPKTISTPTT